MARVTLVVNSFDGVSETFLRSLAAVLEGAGHTVTVHSLRPCRGADGVRQGPNDGLLRSLALPGLRSPLFPPALARLMVGHPFAAATAVRRAARSSWSTRRAARAAAQAASIIATRPDVVHLAFSGIGVTLQDGLALLGGIRLVVSCRGTAELVQPVIDSERAQALRRLFATADAVHAVSQSVATAVRGMGADPRRLVVIRPAVDPTRFRRERPRQPVGHPLRLVTVARLHWVKALDDLLAAVARLRTRGVEASLMIIGDGPERPPLQFRTHVLRLGDAVQFVGSRRPEEVRDLVETADIFVLTSLSEGINNSVLEAMALEVPVVSTSAGGMPEVITDGVDGLLVPIGDAEAVAAAIMRVGQDPDLASRLAAGGRRRVVEAFTLDHQRREIEDLYRGLLDREASAVLGSARTTAAT